MGLAERRAAADFEKNLLPKHKADIIAAMTFEVPIEVDLATLSKEGASAHYGEAWPKVYFQPLVAALKSICADDMGKEALKGALKSIQIKNSSDIYSSSRWATFENGVLTLDHDPWSNVDEVKDRTDALIKLLEAKL
ncbi:MAG TPA: hypothetical protein VGO62_11485 [Myxococcota bacterium]